jgi:hypothetical protein
MCVPRMKSAILSRDEKSDMLKVEAARQEKASFEQDYDIIRELQTHASLPSPLLIMLQVTLPRVGRDPKQAVCSANSQFVA